MNTFKLSRSDHFLKYYYAIVLTLMIGLFLIASPLYLHVINQFKFSWGSFLLAMAIYLFSHLCRVARLAFLTLDNNVKFRQLFRLHFHTAALSRMLPFKLGELNRIYLLGSLFDQRRNAIMVVWIERLFDSLVLALFLLFLAFSYSDSMMSHLTLVSLLGFFIIVSFFTFFVLPENLNSIKRVLIMRYNKKYILKLLKWVSNTEQFVKLAPGILQKKIITLILLSTLVWVSEVFAIVVLVVGDFSLSKLSSAIYHLPERLTNEFYQSPTSFFSHANWTDINWSSLLTLGSLFCIGLICLYFDYKANQGLRYSLKAGSHG